ncbi:MAG: hypothetical protein RR992_09900, partial [Clostridiales bacterium]
SNGTFKNGIDIKSWPAGDYYCILDVGDGDYYQRVTSILSISPNADAYLEKVMAETLNFFETNAFIRASGDVKEYMGVEYEWNALPFSAMYSYTHDDKFKWDSKFLSGADGKTYPQRCKEMVFHKSGDVTVDMKTTEQFIKEADFGGPAEKTISRYLLSAASAGVDPRSYGKYEINLVNALISFAYEGNDIKNDLKLDANGALNIGAIISGVRDPLSSAFLVLGAEVANATEAEGYTNELKVAAMKNIALKEKPTLTGEVISDFYSMGMFPLYFLEDDASCKESARQTLDIFKADILSAIAGSGRLGAPFSTAQMIEYLTMDGYSYKDFCTDEKWQRNGVSLGAEHMSAYGYSEGVGKGSGYN